MNIERNIRLPRLINNIIFLCLDVLSVWRITLKLKFWINSILNYVVLLLLLLLSSSWIPKQLDHGWWQTKHQTPLVWLCLVQNVHQSQNVLSAHEILLLSDWQLATWTYIFAQYNVGLTTMVHVTQWVMIVSTCRKLLLIFMIWNFTIGS